MSAGNVIQELLIRVRYVVDNGGLERTKTALSSIKKMVAGFAVGATLYKMGRAAITTAADLEAAQAQFETMLGSKAAADKMMNEMWAYAALSTFEMSDVTRVSTTMLQYGMTQDEVTDSMKRLGDVAGASGPKFQRLALALAQMKGKGRLTGEEVRQFVNAGWNPLKQIARDHFGGDIGAAEKAMTKKKISAQMVMDALREVTSEGGMFYQNQMRQSQTLLGRYTTMIDNLKMAGSKMVMAFSGPLKQMMLFVGRINFGPVVRGVQTLSYAVQYLSLVVWNSGLREGWAAFAESMGGVSFAARDLNGVLRYLGEYTGSTLGTVFRYLTLVSPILKIFMLLLRALSPVLYVAGVAIRVVTEGLNGLLTVASSVWWWLQQIASTVMDLSRWFAGVSEDISAATGHANDFANIMMIVNYATEKVRNLLREMREILPLVGEGFLLLIAPVGSTVKLVMMMGWALYKLNKMLDEMVLRSEMDGENAARGSVEDELNRRSAALDAAKASGNKQEIEKAQRHWQALRAAYKKVYLDKPFGEPDFGDTTFESFVKREQEGSAAAVKKMVSTSGKTTTVNQKVDFKVNVEGDKNAKTGLTAADVAMLAERASRATFSLELERVLETVM